MVPGPILHRGLHRKDHGFRLRIRLRFFWRRTPSRTRTVGCGANTGDHFAAEAYACASTHARRLEPRPHGASICTELSGEQHAPSYRRREGVSRQVLSAGALPSPERRQPGIAFAAIPRSVSHARTDSLALAP